MFSFIFYTHKITEKYICEVLLFVHPLYVCLFICLCMCVKLPSYTYMHKCHVKIERKCRQVFHPTLFTFADQSNEKKSLFWGKINLERSFTPNRYKAAILPFLFSLHPPMWNSLIFRQVRKHKSQNVVCTCLLSWMEGKLAGSFHWTDSTSSLPMPRSCSASPPAGDVKRLSFTSSTSRDAYSASCESETDSSSQDEGCDATVTGTPARRHDALLWASFWSEICALRDSSFGRRTHKN